MVQESHDYQKDVHPRYLPMLVPPRPWRRYNDGGHITIPSVVMRGNYSRLGPSPAQLQQLQEYERATRAQVGAPERAPSFRFPSCPAPPGLARTRGSSVS